MAEIFPGCQNKSRFFKNILIPSEQIVTVGQIEMYNTAVRNFSAVSPSADNWSDSAL